ncbi:MAG: hypothetical protein HY314_02805 [Acidobacteria bacterium]|nr:hypothetical protein [Acidobacteriota bacterium]
MSTISEHQAIKSAAKFYGALPVGESPELLYVEPRLVGGIGDELHLAWRVPLRSDSIPVDYY